jgi:4-hydroxybenzoate polyprenyltransferase
VRRSAYFQLGANRTGLLIELEDGASQQIVAAKITAVLQERKLAPSMVRYVKKIPLDKRHNAKIDYNEIKKSYGGHSMTISPNDPLLKRFWAYTQERFPLIPILLFSALFSANAFWLGQSGFQLENWHFPLWRFGVTMVTIFLVFFHLRLLDEFKDYADDKLAYPERLLSRGVVTLDLLGKIAFLFIFCEIVFSAFLGKQALILSLIVIIYSLLMFKEFFIGKWLRQSMSAYLISHQLILPLMVYFALFVAVGGSVNPWTHLTTLILIFFAVSLPSTIYEIARKTWSAERDSENADSYTREWGVTGSVVVLTLLYISYLILGYFLFFNFGLNFWGLYLLGMLSFVGIVTALFFLVRPTTKNSKLVELGGSLLLLGGHLSFLLGALLG